MITVQYAYRDNVRMSIIMMARIPVTRKCTGALGHWGTGISRFLYIHAQERYSQWCSNLNDQCRAMTSNHRGAWRRPCNI